MTYELAINVLAGLDPISIFKPVQLFELLEYCRVDTIPKYRYDSLREAMNVPLSDIRNAIGVTDRRRKYLACCQSERRSATAAFIVAQARYNVQVLDGGLWSVPRLAQQ